MSKEVQIFIRSLLEPNPEKRPTAQECLRMKWIRKFSKSKACGTNIISKSALRNLQKFNCRRKMELAIVNYIANFLTSAQNQKALRETFLKLDKDKDGVLSRNDLIEGFASYWGNKVFLEAEIDKILEAVDINKNGVIDYSEFVTAASSFKEMLTESNLREAFKQFDIDGDGKICFDELKKILGCPDEEDQEINNIIAIADRNNDGMIDFDEFKRMMNIFLKRNSTLCKPKFKKTSDEFGVNIILQARRATKIGLNKPNSSDADLHS